MNRILIVEDEEAIANLIRLNLSRAGYYCEVVYDGVAGADCLAEKRYDSYGASDTEVTIALRHAYEKATPTETFNAELFLQTVRLVLMDKDGNITICLNNNIEV